MIKGLSLVSESVISYLPNILLLQINKRCLVDSRALFVRIGAQPGLERTKTGLSAPVSDPKKIVGCFVCLFLNFQDFIFI